MTLKTEKRVKAHDLIERKKLKVVAQQNLVNEQWVLFGRVLGPHGIRGALKVHLNNPSTESLRPGLELGFELATKDLVLLKVSSVMGGGRLSFADITDRDEAEAFAKFNVFVRRADFPVALDEEVYLIDLLGAQAVDLSGNVLGKVIAFSDNRAQPLIEIETEAKTSVLLPFVHPILREIREHEHVVVLDPPTGFFD